MINNIFNIYAKSGPSYKMSRNLRRNMIIFLVDPFKVVRTQVHSLAQVKAKKVTLKTVLG